LKLINRRALPGYKGDEDDLRFLIRKMEIRKFKEIQDWIECPVWVQRSTLPNKNSRKIEKAQRTGASWIALNFAAFPQYSVDIFLKSGT